MICLCYFRQLIRLMILYYHFLCYVSCYLHLYYFIIVAFIYLNCSSNSECILCWHCIHLMPYEDPFSTPKRQLILELLWSNKSNHHLFHGKRPLNLGEHIRPSITCLRRWVRNWNIWLVHLNLNLVIWRIFIRFKCCK